MKTIHPESYEDTTTTEQNREFIVGILLAVIFVYSIIIGNIYYNNIYTKSEVKEVEITVVKK